MTVTEMLLKADTKKANEYNEGTFESKMMARALGKDEPITIKIKEIPPKKLAEYMDGTVGNGNEMDMPKLYEASKKIVVAGVVDPDLKSKDLQEHFGCKLAVDLAEKLFRSEIYKLSTAVQALSDVADVDEDEVKN